LLIRIAGKERIGLLIYRICNHFKIDFQIFPGYNHLLASEKSHFMDDTYSVKTLHGPAIGSFLPLWHPRCATDIPSGGTGKGSKKSPARDVEVTPVAGICQGKGQEQSLP